MKILLICACVLFSGCAGTLPVRPYRENPAVIIPYQKNWSSLAEGKNEANYTLEK